MKKWKVNQNSSVKEVKEIGVKQMKTLNKQLPVQKIKKEVSFEKV